MSTAIQRINPDQLHRTAGYHHVTVVEAGRTAYLAGQCPLDADGSLVGADDLSAQLDQVVTNALVALAAADARPQDVVRSVIYVVTGDRDTLGDAWQHLTATELAPAFTSASTLLGVTQLGYRDQLVEIDLTAALRD